MASSRGSPARQYPACRSTTTRSASRGDEPEGSGAEQRRTALADASARRETAVLPSVSNAG